jgi:hypothetical protein
MHVIMGLFEVHETSGNLWPYNSNPYWRSMDYYIN